MVNKLHLSIMIQGEWLKTLEASFKEILLNEGETVMSKNSLMKTKFKEEPQLPCLIYGQTIIQDSFAAIQYLCFKYKKQDLLGMNLEERAIIKEICYNTLIRKKKAIKVLFNFGEFAACQPCKKQEIRRQAMQASFKYSGSILQCIQLKSRNLHQKYIFSHITILDFFFYEECFYHINLFGNLEQKNCKILETINSIFGTDLQNAKEKTSIFLKVMRQFKQNFQIEPFYLKNRQKLESYSVTCKEMGQKSKKAFQSVWLGSTNYLK